MTLWVARDGSHNYGAASEHFLGEEGAFCVPVIRRRMGQARQLVVKSSVSSPIRVDVLACAVQAEQER